MPNSAEILKQKFTHSIGLPFQEILPESVIASVLEQENVRYRDRSNRHEPRVRKRRPKAFPLMKQPRSTLKANLAN